LKTAGGGAVKGIGEVSRGHKFLKFAGKVNQITGYTGAREGVSRVEVP
jgi:hypothetical protein